MWYSSLDLSHFFETFLGSGGSGRVEFERAARMIPGDREAPCGHGTTGMAISL